MAEYKLRGLPIEFDKLPYVKMPEGHSEYWVGKNRKGLPPSLPEGVEDTRPSFRGGGKVSPFAQGGPALPRSGVLAAKGPNKKGVW